MGKERQKILEAIAAILNEYKLRDCVCISPGKFEAQTLATIYFYSQKEEEGEHLGEGIYLFQPTCCEVDILGAPNYSSYFLLETHQDNTCCGAWLAQYEVDALKTRLGFYNN
jgi:hypothetical protein